jgi:hypothetical protein
MLTASTAYLSLFWTSREAHAGPNELSGNRFALLSPPIAVSLVGNLAAAPSCFTREVRTETLALFIDFGLIGKGIHTCRRTFEFLTSGHLRHSGQIVTFSSAQGWLTINAPKRVSRTLHATFGSRSCVFLEFFSLLAEFTYCELSTVKLSVTNGSNPSIIYTRFMS